MKSKLQEQTELYFETAVQIRRTMRSTPSLAKLAAQMLADEMGEPVSPRVAQRIATLSTKRKTKVS